MIFSTPKVTASIIKRRRTLGRGIATIKVTGSLAGTGSSYKGFMRTAVSETSTTCVR